MRIPASKKASAATARTNIHVTVFHIFLTIAGHPPAFPYGFSYHVCIIFAQGYIVVTFRENYESFFNFLFGFM